MKKIVLPSLSPRRTTSQQQQQAPDPKLLEIKELSERLPESVDDYNVFSVIPVLDRILCTISAQSINCSNNPIILGLEEKLFGYINYDDFLLRTIICRILLYCATDSNSPLLTWITEIFLMLSADRANDEFFVSEGITSILITLIKTSKEKPRDNALATLKNITKNSAIQIDPKIIELFSGNIITPDLISIAKHISTDTELREKLLQTEFIRKLGAQLNDESANKDRVLKLFIRMKKVPMEFVDQIINLCELSNSALEVSCFLLVPCDTQRAIDIFQRYATAFKSDESIFSQLVDYGLRNGCFAKIRNAFWFNDILSSLDVSTTSKRAVYNEAKRLGMSEVVADHSYLELPSS